MCLYRTVEGEGSHQRYLGPVGTDKGKDECQEQYGWEHSRSE